MRDAPSAFTYEMLTPETLAAIREAAASHGLPLVGHVPRAVPFEAARLSDAQHFIGIPTFESCGAEQDTVACLARGWETLGAERIEQVVAISLQQGIVHTPTLVVYDRISRQADYETQRADPVARLLPAFYRDVFWQPSQHPLTRNIPNESLHALGRQVDRMKELLFRLHRAGVGLHLGSDALNPFVVPGAGLQEEMGHFVEDLDRSDAIGGRVSRGR
jgi:hypothetical protein